MSLNPIRIEELVIYLVGVSQLGTFTLQKLIDRTKSELNIQNVAISLPVRIEVWNNYLDTRVKGILCQSWLPARE